VITVHCQHFRDQKVAKKPGLLRCERRYERRSAISPLGIIS
jgi:hypothetical protein